VAGLLIIILGFEVLESSVEVIISTIIPLSLSLGLISEYLPGLTVFYLAFILLGFLAIVGTRFAAPGLIALAVLTVVHGVSGLLIFVLPILFSLQGKASPGFVFVGIGGALMGIEGLLLSFDKLGHPILCRNAILKGLPGLLLLMTAAFVVGFAIR
jgi:hypothetical protein